MQEPVLRSPGPSGEGLPGHHPGGGLLGGRSGQGADGEARENWAATAQKKRAEKPTVGGEYWKRDFSYIQTEPPGLRPRKGREAPGRSWGVCSGWVRRPLAGDLDPPRPRAEGALRGLLRLARIRSHQTWGQRASRTPIV